MIKNIKLNRRGDNFVSDTLPMYCLCADGVAEFCNININNLPNSFEFILSDEIFEGALSGKYYPSSLEVEINGKRIKMHDDTIKLIFEKQENYYGYQRPSQTPFFNLFFTLTPL